jgi:hypothetical protein
MSVFYSGVFNLVRPSSTHNSWICFSFSIAAFVSFMLVVQ